MAKSKGVQFIVYDIGGNNLLSQKVISELEKAIEEIVKKHQTLAYTVVNGEEIFTPQEAKSWTYKPLKVRGLPIPPDLVGEIEG